MSIIDTCALLHDPMIDYWTEKMKRTTPMYTRFERAMGTGSATKELSGDVILERLQDTFLNGFGIKWSPVQINIFQALVDSILPRIYLNEWEEAKGRVMAQRNLDRLYQETLVNMARRNGKTWVVSGAAAAVFLTVPGVSLAVFSVGKRQAGMFMTSAVEKLELAFNRGYGKGFKFIQKNQETVIYEHPQGGKQILGCYPGSTKVISSPLFKMVIRIRILGPMDRVSPYHLLVAARDWIAGFDNRNRSPAIILRMLQSAASRGEEEAQWFLLKLGTKWPKDIEYFSPKGRWVARCMSGDLEDPRALYCLGRSNIPNDTDSLRKASDMGYEPARRLIDVTCPSDGVHPVRWSHSESHLCNARAFLLLKDVQSFQLYYHDVQKMFDVGRILIDYEEIWGEPYPYEAEKPIFVYKRIVGSARRSALRTLMVLRARLGRDVARMIAKEVYMCRMEAEIW